MLGAHFNAKMQGFLAFVLSHHVSEGVQELDQDKLKPLLSLEYHGAIADASRTWASRGRSGRRSRAFRSISIKPEAQPRQTWITA